ncbi:DUF1232 domain-containing protein [bacterium]|nr:MAG: DUF1232 domain-containing protein [bacterium]
MGCILRLQGDVVIVVNPRVTEGLSKALRNKALISAAVAILYGASPIDVIPDIIPVLGLVDDAIVVPAFLLLALLQYRRSRRVAETRGPVASGVPGPVIRGSIVPNPPRR